MCSARLEFDLNCRKREVQHGSDTLDTLISTTPHPSEFLLLVFGEVGHELSRTFARRRCLRCVFNPDVVPRDAEPRSGCLSSEPLHPLAAPSAMPIDSTRTFAAAALNIHVECLSEMRATCASDINRAVFTCRTPLDLNCSLSLFPITRNQPVRWNPHAQTGEDISAGHVTGGHAPNSTS